MPVAQSTDFGGGFGGALWWAFLLGDTDTMLQSYNIWAAITPSDTVDITRPTNAILIGGTGDVAAVMQNGSVVTLKTLPAGACVPIACRRVNATGTTATNLVALYQQ